MFGNDAAFLSNYYVHLLLLLLYHSPLELDLSSVPGSRALVTDSTSLLFIPVPSSVNSAVTTGSHSIIIKRPAESEEASTSIDVSPVCKMPKLADDICTTVTSCVTPGTLHYVMLRCFMLSWS